MKKYISIIILFFTFGMDGCKKDYLSQEINPNNPSVTTPQYSLAGAEETTARNLTHDYPHYGEWGGYWCWSGSYVPDPQFQQFAISIAVPPSPGDAWGDNYGNLTNYNNLQVASALVPADANFEAIAMIMKAYDFEQLVDNYNNVPYTQAFKPSTILFPAYDSGQSIYNDLVVQLDAAIALITKNGATATNPGTSDVIYGGNMTNWQKFANTLKLRLAIHQSNLSTNTAQADLASTASIGYIDASSEADCQPGYTNALGKQNPFYAEFGYDQNGNPVAGYLTQRSNIVASNLMKSLNDPRDSAYYLTVSGKINALQLGNPNNATNAVSSPFGPGILKSPTQPAIVFSSYESLFLQAEAAARGWIPGSASALYNAGITASFNAVNAQGPVAAYLAQPSVAYPAAGTLAQQVQAIITQKYISLNSLFNLEAYNEFRRTGYPVLPQNPASQDPAAVSPTLPTRIPYPISELNTNEPNLDAQGDINPFTSKIFWAK
jgi:Starch-binding associating with outer membrane